jgi:hypothetical protein
MVPAIQRERLWFEANALEDPGQPNNSRMTRDSSPAYVTNLQHSRELVCELYEGMNTASPS